MFAIHISHQSVPCCKILNMFMAVSNNILKIHKKYFHMDEKFAYGICGHQKSRKQNLEKQNITLLQEIKYNCKQIQFKGKSF